MRRSSTGLIDDYASGRAFPLGDAAWTHLCDEVAADPDAWWDELRPALEQASDPDTLLYLAEAPLAALLQLGEPWPTRVVELARTDRRVAAALVNAFWVEDDALAIAGRLIGHDMVAMTYDRYCLEGAWFDDWAPAVVDRLVDEGPDDAWLLLEALVEAASDREVERAIGAGVLEPFLAEHPHRYGAVAADPRFRVALEEVRL